MTITDETLMAFADGEMNDVDREAVEKALRADPELQRRVAQHRALRARLREAYAAELNEPVAERLTSAATATARPHSAAVVDLQQVRAAAARRNSPKSVGPRWRIGAIAASLLIVCGVGYLLVRAGSESLLREVNGTLVANRSLDDLLSRELSHDPQAGSAVTLGVSFLAKSGEYCRTFSTRTEQPLSGLACRAEGRWDIRALSQSDRAAGASSDFRTASSAMTPLILQLVEQQIAGEPLDAQGEMTAKNKHWEADSREQKLRPAP